jgi:PleD family two-component response regulator
MIPERAATFSCIRDDDACRSVDRKALGCRTQPSELVVDDAADNRTLPEFLLSSVGYAVATASDGREALNCLAALRPAVILLDLESR